MSTFSGLNIAPSAQLHNRVAMDVASSNIADVGTDGYTRRTVQGAVTDQVDGSNEQLSGVNVDQETVAMLAAQNAYEAAFRVMTTLDSVLNMLMNRHGLTH